MIMQKINIKELLGASELKRFLTRFVRCLNIPLSLYEANHQIILPVCSPNPVCKMIYNTKEGCIRCNKNYKELLEANNNEETIYQTCHAGFQIFSIPIEVNIEIVCYVIGAQIRTKKLTKKKRNHLLELASSIGISDLETFTSVLNQIPIKSNEELTNASALIGQTLSQLTYHEFEIDRLMTDILNKYEEITSLHEIQETLGSELRLDRLVNLILRQAVSIVDAEAGSIMLIDTNTNQLVSYESYGTSNNEEIRFEIGEGIAGKVVETGISIIVNDTSLDPSFIIKTDHHKAINNMMCVPLMTQERVVGAINLNNKKNEASFTSADERLVSSLGAQAAIAIENANLYKELEDEKEKIEKIINTSADGIIVTDPKTHIILMNYTAREIFNISQDEPLNSNAIQRNTVLNILQHKMEKVKGASTDFDIIVMKPNRFILSARTSTLRDHNGEVMGSIISLRNVTEYKRAETKRRELISFLAHGLPDLSNEILNAIRYGISQSEKEHFIEKTAIIDNRVSQLWNFLQYAAGPLRIEKTETILMMAIYKMKEIFLPMLLKHNLQIKVIYEPDILPVRFDDMWMKKLLYLLIDNAIKFSKKDAKIIIINVYSIENEKVQIDITNYGEYITPEHIQIIFDPFKQLDELEEMRLSHISIGLTFSKHIVDAHGGWLKFTSQEDGTNTVSFVLPQR